MGSDGRCWGKVEGVMSAFAATWCFQSFDSHLSDSCSLSIFVPSPALWIQFPGPEPLATSGIQRSELGRAWWLENQ